jgi:hypothetical protein
MARKALLSDPLAAKVIPPAGPEAMDLPWQTGVKISYRGMPMIDMDQIWRHANNRYKIKFSRLIPFRRWFRAAGYAASYIVREIGRWLRGPWVKPLMTGARIVCSPLKRRIAGEMPKGFADWKRFVEKMPDIREGIALCRHTYRQAHFPASTYPNGFTCWYPATSAEPISQKSTLLKSNFYNPSKYLGSY